MLWQLLPPPELEELDEEDEDDVPAQGRFASETLTHSWQWHLTPLAPPQAAPSTLHELPMPGQLLPPELEELDEEPSHEAFLSAEVTHLPQWQ
jgi:hypothetical protein